MAFMLAHLKVPLSWWEIFRRTFYEAFFKDNCLGMAAQLAYYFFFALFPALLVVLVLANYFYDPDFVDNMFLLLGGVVPRAALEIITEQIVKIRENQGGLLTVGMVTALWSSSAAMTAIIDTLNNAYDIDEGRPWWKVRLTAIVLTVGMAAFIVVSFTLVLAGPSMAERLTSYFGLGAAFEWGWKILQWPLVFTLVSAGVALVYYFAPDAEQDWVWLTPGSILATTMWLLASLGFKYYVSTLGGYESYGVVGGVMVLMLWFYISGLMLLLGAELNAEIEHSSPYGKDSGEKVPGQKRKLGPAAMRAWMRRRQKTGENPPSADDVKKVVGETPPEREPGAPLPEGVERERVQEAAQTQARVQQQEEKAKERVH
jgi:membrane protein